MPDKKFKTPNGQIVNESELKTKYGEKFSELVGNKTFSEVTENVYRTPNGKFETESVLKEKYKDDFVNLTSNNTFVLEKKNPIGTSTSTTQSKSLASEQTNGSSATPPMQTLKKGEKLYKEAPTALTPKPKIKPLDENIKKLRPTAEFLATAKEIKDRAFTTDINLAKQNLEDEKNNSQTLDYLREGAKGVVNFSSDVLNEVMVKPLNQVMTAFGDTTTEDIENNKGIIPLIDRFDKFTPLQKEKDEIVQSNPKVKFTPEQLQQEAEKLFIQKDLDKQIAKNFDDLMQDAPIGVQSYLKSKEIETLDLKSPELKRNTAMINVIDKSYEETKSSIEADNKIIEEAQRLGKPLGQEFIDSYKTKIEEINQTKQTYLDLLDKNQSLSEEIQGAKKSLDLFKLNYSPMDKYSASLINTTKSLLGGGLSMVSEFTSPTKDYSKAFKEKTAELGSELIADAKNNNKQFREIHLDDVQTFRDFGRYTANLIAEQTPIIASMAIGGEAGLAFLGSASGGQKIEEMRKDASNNYSDAQIKLTGLGFALAEAIPEMNTLRIIKGAKKQFKK